MNIRIAATLVCLVLPVTALAQAQAQSQAQARTQTSPQSCAVQSRPRHSVSAADLHIPAKAWQHFERARTASENNQPDVFDREFAQALAADPSFAELYLLRAALELRRGQYDAALRTIETARALEPSLPWASIVVAGALTQLGHYDQALAELDRARGDEAGSWQDKFERARAELGRRHPEAALHWSQLAVTAAPAGCTDARLVLANAYQLSGQTPQAIAQLETYLAEDRQHTRRPQVQAALERTRAQQAEQELAAVHPPTPQN